MRGPFLKKVVAIVLSAALLFGGVPLKPAADLIGELMLTASAEGEITTISSIEDWNSFAASVNSGNNYENITVTLMNDVGSVSTTVGTEANPFKGTFDGNNKVLTVNISDTSAQGTAPFRYIADATIKDLTVMGTVTGTTHAAGLVGFNWSGSSLIDNCIVQTSVSVAAGSNRHMGGVVGHGKTAALTMKDTVFSGTMTNSQNYAGGLLGWSDGCTLTIDNCFFTGSYSGSGSFHPIAVRDNNKAMTTNVKNCYYTAAPTLTNSNYIAANGVEAYTVRPWLALFCKLTAPDGGIYYAPATVSMSSRKYPYTGEPVNVSFMVTDPYNNILENGTDYTGSIFPLPVRDIGTYTLTVNAVSGSGRCVGSQDVSFAVTGTTQSSSDYLALDNTVKTASDPTTLTSSTTTWSNGKWYVASGDVTIDSRVTVSGDVNLILCDGATLTCTKGITVSSIDSLTVWGQSAQTGTLLIEKLNAADAGIGGYFNGDKNSGDLFFNGGMIDVQNEASGNAIGGSLYGSAGTIFINRGIVRARCETYYHAFTIGGGSTNTYDPNPATIEISEDMLITDPNIVLRKNSNTHYFYDTVNNAYPEEVTLAFGYNAIVPACSNGTVALDKYKTIAGDTVNITAQPNDGYVLGGVTVTDENGNNVTVTNNSFTMPSAGVTVTANFLRIGGTVTVSDDIEGGTVTAQPTTQTEGSPVTVTASPDAIHSLSGPYYYDPSGTRVDITQTNGTYSFTMPAYDVVIYADFEKISYSITKDENADDTYGTVSFDSTASYQDTVVLDVRPNEDGVLTKLCYKTPSGNSVDITADGNGEYSFIMPDCNVTIEYDFEPCHTVVVEFGDTHADLAAMLNGVEGCTVSGTRVTMTVAGETVWEAKSRIEEITQNNVWLILFAQHPEQEFIYITENGDCVTSPFVEVGLKPMTGYASLQDRNSEGAELCQNGQVFYIQWERPFTGEASVTVSPLICGTEVTKSQSNGFVYSNPEPEITLSSNLSPATYFLQWRTAYDEQTHDTSGLFEGTAQGGTVYYIAYYFNMPFGYYCTNPNEQIKYYGAECLYTELRSGGDRIYAVFAVTAEHEWEGGECTHCDTASQSHNINITPSQNGTVTAEASAPYTKLVTLNVTPDDGFSIKSVYVDGDEIVPVNDEYTFRMPDHEVTVTAEFERNSLFVGHSLTLSGEVGVDFYIALSDEELGEGAVVDFAWTVNGTENNSTVTITAADKTSHGYKATALVAVAEMTCDVTAVLSIGGEQAATDTISVRRYCDELLSDKYKTKFITANGEEEYNKLETLVYTMLDYGAKAQIAFETNIDDLANDEIDYTMKKVTASAITPTQSNMESVPESYGLEYAGSTIVYLSKTSIRHYYRIVDQDKFDAVKDSVTFDGAAVTYAEKNDLIYFELKNVASNDFDHQYTLRIGTSEYDYSVLDYVYVCLAANNAPYATRQLVSATYWYYLASESYVGD